MSPSLPRLKCPLFSFCTSFCFFPLLLDNSCFRIPQEQRSSARSAYGIPVFPLELHPHIWVVCVWQLVVITSEWPVTRGQPHPVTQMITATLHRTDRLPQLEIRYFSSG